MADDVVVIDDAIVSERLRIQTDIWQLPYLEVSAVAVSLLGRRDSDGSLGLPILHHQVAYPSDNDNNNERLYEVSDHVW